METHPWIKMVSPKKNRWFSSLITRVSFRGSFLSKNRRIQDDHYLLLTKKCAAPGMYQKFPKKITRKPNQQTANQFSLFLLSPSENTDCERFFQWTRPSGAQKLGPCIGRVWGAMRGKGTFYPPPPFQPVQRFIRTLKEAGLIMGYWWIFFWKNLLNKALLPGWMAFKFRIEYQGRVETSWAKSCSN